MNGFVKIRLQSLLNKTAISTLTEATFSQGGNVLILSPHYDDDVISCFGAMTKHYEQGAHLDILYLTDGTTSKDSGLTKEELHKIRKVEAANAVNTFFKDVNLEHFNHEDGHFAMTLEDVTRLSKLLQEKQYDYIYCPSITDTHEDHKETYKLLRQALLESGLKCTIRLYEFWYPLKKPNVYVDFADCEEKKWESIACHQSQMKYLNYVELAQTVNAHRGLQAERKWCEVYEEMSSSKLIWDLVPSLKASVVIPAYNNEAYVAIMLKALQRQTLDTFCWEIVLVDDSEDNRMTQFEKWELPNLRVIEKEHSGRADARNVGIQNSRGEVIIFMDSDMIVEESFVEKHYASHRETGSDITLGKVNHICHEHLEEVRKLVLEDRTKELEAFVMKDEYLNLTPIVFQNKEAADNIGWVCCLFSNCSVRRKVLDKGGVFDVIFKGWGLEDIELGYRFFKEKFSFSYEEDIANYHVDHATNSQQMLVEMGRNLKRLSKKHPDAAIKSYMSFVAGFKDLQELLCDVAKKEIAFDNGSGVYFRPISYTKSKA